MTAETNYVFSDGINLFAKTPAELTDELGTWNTAEAIVEEERKYDAKLAYMLKPLQRVELLGESEDTIYVIVDLDNQLKLVNPCECLAGDSDLLDDDYAIEAIVDGCFGKLHQLYSYNKTTLNLLKSLESNQDVVWTNESELDVLPLAGKKIQCLELPEVGQEEFEKAHNQVILRRVEAISDRISTTVGLPVHSMA